MWRLVWLLILASLLSAETFKLYLKTGEFHLVREYQVQSDRVRYFSTERGDWEEIPKDLVDLSKTEEERKSRKDVTTRSARAEDEEEQAERAQRKEIASIPMEAGAYFKNESEKEIKALAQSDYEVITSKRRKAMQMISPVPIIPGKATVVIKGERSAFTIQDKRPSFFLRLAKEEKFGIIRLLPQKGKRIVENISVVPVSKQGLEERKQIDTFEQQLMWNLYRVWPERSLEPGEYALMEYSEATDTDDIQLLIWDFAVIGKQ